MSREIFKARVVPQEGITREQFEVQLQPKVESYRKRFVDDFVSPYKEMGYELTPEDYATAQSITEPHLKIDLETKLEEEKRDRIFQPAIAAMRVVAKKHAGSLPDNLLSRLIFIDNQSFRNLLNAMVSTEDKTQTAFGATYPDRICFLDLEYIEILGEADDEKGKDEILLEVGIHELWHSLQYNETWEKDEETEPRRAGIQIKRPRLSSFPGISEQKVYQTIGLSLLCEGFTQYLTRETLLAMEQDISPFRKNSFYKGELEIVDILVKKIGEEAFFDASFTKKGFRNLYKEIDKKLGHNSFKLIAKYMGADHVTQSLAQEKGKKLPPFRATKAFIKAKSALRTVESFFGSIFKRSSKK